MVKFWLVFCCATSVIHGDQHTHVAERPKSYSRQQMSFLHHSIFSMFRVEVSLHKLFFPLCRGKSEGSGAESHTRTHAHTEDCILGGCPWLLFWKVDRYCVKWMHTHSAAGQGFIHTTHWTNRGLYSCSWVTLFPLLKKAITSLSGMCGQSVPVELRPDMFSLVCECLFPTPKT